MNRICYLENSIQEYAWGSTDAIPTILGIAPDGKPKAELWMGAHPKAPSKVIFGDKGLPLPKLIKEEGEKVIGAYVENRFGRQLPFLFKIIAADTPLSIQAHPNLIQAREGFERENSLGILIDSPERNYRDDNHKPEIISALTPFWVLAGFRKISDIVVNLEHCGLKSISKEIDYLIYNQTREGLRQFFKALMELSLDRKREVVEDTVKFAAVNKDVSPIFDWVLKLNNSYPGDIGVISPLLLNLILLKPGEALFLGAGELHAYLEGVGMELMANSDNVLRGGLTPKHMDVAELLKVLTFNSGESEIIYPKGVGESELLYECSSVEFCLSIIDLKEGDSHTSSTKRGVEILIAVEGDMDIRWGDGLEMLRFNKGKVILVPSSVKGYKISGIGKVYKASVPR